jgi:hypothetical protein
MEYAHNYESCVGTALRKTGLARSEFFITTKYGPGDVQEEVRNSLEKVCIWKAGALSPLRQTSFRISHLTWYSR